MGYSLGVDVGTTFMTAALARETGAEPVTLGDPTPVVRGQPSAVSTLLREVLRKVVETEGGPPDRVALTRPANWGSISAAMFTVVAKEAGLVDPLIVTEPEAVVARYAATRGLADGETVAVYDLGGDTFDATVLRKLPDAGIEIIGSPESVARLGGVDFDEVILGYVDVISDGALSRLDMRDPQTTAALATLRRGCMQAKERLSADTETILPVLLPDRPFDVAINRSDFEDMIRTRIETTIGALSRTLESARVEPADLSAVLLVGGSSRIPLVARLVSAELGRPVAVDAHPEHAAALGATILAAQATVPRAGATGPRRPAAQSPTSPRIPAPAALPSAPSPEPAIPAGRATGTDRRRLLLVTAVLVAAAAATVVAWKPSGDARPGPMAELVLTASEVRMGDSYFATATGFAPGEVVRLSWIGPTSGTMDAVPVDAAGSGTRGPITEQDPPGTYSIIATGLTSGKVASTVLQVLPAQ